MGQQQSQPMPESSTRWLDGVKLACLTTAVAALQFIRYQLTHDDRQERRRRDGSGRDGNNLLNDLPPDFRRACVSLIDYHAMPLLVDQWRLKLVSVLLGPETGAAPSSCSAADRQTLLGSLNSFQQARRSANARTSQPRQPTVMSPSAPAPAVNGHSPSTNQTSAGRKLPHHDSAFMDAPGPAQAAQPTAPPLPDDLLRDHMQPDANSSGAVSQEECHICMEADVEVRVGSCQHGMCIECARAVCSMPDRAPQCPFCRGPILTLAPVLDPNDIA